MATVFVQKRNRANRKSYVVYFKDPSTMKLKYYKSFQKQREAQDAANGLRSLIDTGQAPEIQRRKAKLSFLTFYEVGVSLTKEWDDRFNRNNLKKNSLEDYCIRLNVLNRTFGKRLLCEISKEEIGSYINEAATVNSNVTANRSLSIIRKVFSHGAKLKAIVADPSKDVGFLSEKDHERNRFLLPKELDRLLETAGKVRGKYYLPALICLGSEHGASKQEALSLKWGDVDFEYKGRGIIRFFRIKNGRERIEYLMPRTKETLLAWREHQTWMRHRKRITSIKSDLVFCRLDGTPIKRFHKAWRTLCKAVAIDDFHFHDLRHTFCSNLILSGSGLKEVKEMIGHSDISMTDRYSHLTLEHKRLRQEELAKHYSQ